MNVTININIAIQPATEVVHTEPVPILEQPTLENDVAKAAMVIKRLAYRQRIADKLRTTFGDDTANRFLAGAL